ncbi:pyridoxine 5'-phosphate synthase, partial [Flavobacterium sp. B17]|uniref:pyridoxine 5'-phosphate synthase n=1 Tax=Flavobacterium sp. B17 TaxID=95618 RepID=UPI0005B264CA
MTKLSVNINKIATIRNARGGNTPSVTEAAVKIQEFGGQGITIHPRPDERHITRKDVYDLKLIGKQLAGYASDAMDNFTYRLSNGNSLAAMVNWANSISVDGTSNKVNVQD